MAKILKVIDDWKSISADARESLLLFTQQTKPRYRTNWHHRKLAEQLDRVAQGEVPAADGLHAAAARQERVGLAAASRPSCWAAIRTCG